MFLRLVKYLFILIELITIGENFGFTKDEEICVDYRISILFVHFRETKKLIPLS